MAYTVGMRNAVLVLFYGIMLIPVIPALPFILLLRWAEGESPSKRRIRALQAQAAGQNWL